MKRIEHFAGKADRTIMVPAKGEKNAAPKRLSHFELAGLPDEIIEDPELMRQLNIIASAAAAATGANTKTKPGRLDKKAQRLIESLAKDFELFDRLNMSLGSKRAGILMRELKFGLRAHVKLTASDVGQAVAEVLQEHGHNVTTSKTGYLVRILELIRDQTGFATNPQDTARAVI